MKCQYTESIQSLNYLKILRWKVYYYHIFLNILIYYIYYAHKFEIIDQKFKINHIYIIEPVHDKRVQIKSYRPSIFHCICI